jgi:hypothetical protein
MFPVPANLAGLTLYPTPDGRWQAAVTVDRIGWRVAVDADPWAAVTAALGLLIEDAVDVDLEDLL